MEINGVGASMNLREIRGAGSRDGSVLKFAWKWHSPYVTRAPSPSVPYTFHNSRIKFKWNSFDSKVRHRHTCGFLHTYNVRFESLTRALSVERMNKGFRLSSSPSPRSIADIISSRHGENTRHKQERRPHTKEDLCLRGSSSGEMHEPLFPTRRNISSVSIVCLGFRLERRRIRRCKP